MERYPVSEKSESKSHVGGYRRAFDQSVSDREGFWLDAAKLIDWTIEPTDALDSAGAPLYRWFAGAELNTCFNALDRHVLAGRGDTTALIYDSPVVGKTKRYSYATLLDKVARFAGVLADAGVTTGDRVIIYMPMMPQAIVAMLACARLGAVHSVVFGGFAAKELAARIDDAEPVAIVTATGGIEPNRVVEYLPTIATALEMARHRVGTVIVKDRPEVPGRASDHVSEGTAWWDWDEQSLTATPRAAVAVAATDPLYILYTSGTTGTPKGVVRDNGGHAVAMAWSMKNIYGVGPGDVMWTASDVGWVVGHSYIVYGPLIAGATTVLYEGKPVGTPDAGAFWRVVSDYRVKTLFTAPTALRAIRKADPHAVLSRQYDLTCLDALFVAGERLDPDTWTWATALLEKPVIDHWWQTETGWAICANPRGIAELETKPGSATFPVPGYDVVILDAKGRPVTRVGKDGNIAIRLPLPPGNLLGIWGSEERFASAYLSAFPGFYATGDSGHFDDDGYLYVMGRTDDVINVAGHRLSTGSLEEVLTLHQAVAECAVLGVHDPIKGQRAAGFVTLKAGASIDHDTLAKELVGLVREHVGPVAAFRDVTILDRLPKTRSGKILRKTIRQIVDGEPYTVPPTIEDPATLDALKLAVHGAAGAPQTTP